MTIRFTMLYFKVQSHNSVWHQRMRAYGHTLAYVRIRPQTLIYVADMLGIRRVRSEYADIHRCTLCYTQRPN